MPVDQVHTATRAETKLLLLILVVLLPLCVCFCCKLHPLLQVALPADFVPTPFVAAGVSLLGCAAGIMVTASHNTKEYNGYKVRAEHTGLNKAFGVLSGTWLG